MYLGEKHVIVLISENQEMIDLRNKIKAQIEQWMDDLVKAVGGKDVNDAVFAFEFARFMSFRGFKNKPVGTGWRRAEDGYWVPKRSTREGKLIDVTIKVLGSSRKLFAPTYIESKDLDKTITITEEGRIRMLSSTLTMNDAGNEFVLFYPQDDSPVPESVTSLGKVLSFGEYWDHYRKTHAYIPF